MDIARDTHTAIAEIEKLHDELQTRKPTHNDVTLVLELLRDFTAVTVCDLLKAGEQQFGKKHIH